MGLLRQVAERLLTCTRDGDQVARRSGDEFIVVLPDLQPSQSPISTVDRLVQALREPFFVAGHEVTVTASVGLSTFPEPATDLESLHRYADIALHRAKEGAVGRLCVFDKRMQAVAQERHHLERDLRKALGAGQLQLFYQPKVTLREGQTRVVGAEALLRWFHPEHGAIRPDRFIPIAEETGLIEPIGTWALHEVCRQRRTWLDETHPTGPISVNVSPVQFGP